MVDRLVQDHTGLLVIDAQERLIGAMPGKASKRSVESMTRLISGARVLGLPILISEQYPKGLGPTDPSLVSASDGAPVLEKTAFSCWQDEAIQAAIKETGRTTWLICGMETHVCVYQTARDLVSANLGAQVIADGCLSRTKMNFRGGLDLCRSAGAEISNVESALFDLIGGKEHSDFREISRLLR